MSQQRIEQITKRQSEINAELSAHDKTWNFDKPFLAYEKARQRWYDEYNRLDAELRMMKPYELSDIPKYGHVMSLVDFIQNVKAGGFIDYDGSGNYCINGKMTNISIYPSDIGTGNIRREFDSIIWFNK